MTNQPEQTDLLAAIAALTQHLVKQHSVTTGTALLAAVQILVAPTTTYRMVSGTDEFSQLPETTVLVSTDNTKVF